MLLLPRVNKHRFFKHLLKDNEMNKLVLLMVLFVLTSCAPYKTPLDDTQIVNGESIIIPPNVDDLPKEN